MATSELDVKVKEKCVEQLEQEKKLSDEENEKLRKEFEAAHDKLNQPAHVDIGLVLRVHRQLKRVQKCRCKIGFRLLENSERGKGFETSIRPSFTFELMMLDIDRKMLKEEVRCLRDTIYKADSIAAPPNLIGQFDTLKMELAWGQKDRNGMHRLLSYVERMQNVALIYNEDTHIMKELDELILTFESRKKIVSGLKRKASRVDPSKGDIQPVEKGRLTQLAEWWRATIGRIQEKFTSVSVATRDNTALEMDSNVVPSSSHSSSDNEKIQP